MKKFIVAPLVYMALLFVVFTASAQTKYGVAHRVFCDHDSVLAIGQVGASDDFEGAGIIISSADKNRRLLNTFADRLDRATPIIKADVMTILFDND